MEKERRCLRCQKMFHSMWSGNRICQRCKGSNSNSMAPSVPAGVRKSMAKKARAIDDESWEATPLLARKKNS